MQNRTMREYTARRGWTIVMQVREVGAGAAQREAREKLLEAARRREIDVAGLATRSLGPLTGGSGRYPEGTCRTGRRLRIALIEALDLTTPIGRAMAGLLAVFAEFEHDVLRERVRSGLAEARLNGKPLGRPRTAALHAGHIRKLYRSRVSKAEIARRLNIGLTSVRRILG